MSRDTVRPAILFVCLGNICRSPLAEGVMRAQYGDRCGLIDSCGTAGYHIGESPDPRMQMTAKRHGIDISNLRGRQLDDRDFMRFDYILTMDRSNLVETVLRRDRLGETRARVERFLESGDVPDPYYGGPDGFEEVFRIVEHGCRALALRLGI